jgi:hypothetical protein
MSSASQLNSDNLFRLHQARYRRLAKTHLQHMLTALAGGTWASRLTRLRAELSPV